MLRMDEDHKTFASRRCARAPGPVTLPLDEIGAICRRYHVARLDLVGSGARGHDFEPETSDFDFLVTFEAGHVGPSLRDYLALEAGLAALTGRRVDLISDCSVVNPYVRAAMDRDRVTVHAA
jgi:predicted nucleotidyltransferase